MTPTVPQGAPVRSDDARTGMQRAEAAMFLAGSVAAAVGIWTTDQPTSSRLAEAAVIVVLALVGWWLAAGPARSQVALEGLAMVAMVAVGVLVAVSQPLSAAPFFMIWPVTLVAYFAPRRRLVPHGLVALAALGAGLVAHVPSPIKLDMFWATAISTGVMAWLVSGVTERQNALRAELAKAADTDPLTGLMNRRAFLPRLEHLAALSQRTGVPLAIVMFDLDHFKRINDTRGHQVGDQVLEHVARSLLGVSRAADLVARLGGEEFVVALPGTGAAEALRYAARAAERMALADAATPVSTSAGICAYGPVAQSADALLARADEALYAAKVAGRGRPAVWDGALRVGEPFAGPAAASDELG